MQKENAMKFALPTLIGVFAAALLLGDQPEKTLSVSTRFLHSSGLEWFGLAGFRRRMMIAGDGGLTYLAFPKTTQQMAPWSVQTPQAGQFVGLCRSARTKFTTSAWSRTAWYTCFRSACTA